MNEVWRAITEIADGHAKLRIAILKKENLDEKNDDGWTPYMWAVRCGHQEAADALKNAGADSSGHFDALLLNAVFENNITNCVHALRNGANPNRKFAGSSIMECAADHAQYPLVQEMINHGAKVQSEMLFTVCHWETADWKISGQEDIDAYAKVVEAFMEAGADPNVRNADGKTPLEAIAGDELTAIETVLQNAQQRSSGDSNSTQSLNLR